MLGFKCKDYKPMQCIVDLESICMGLQLKLQHNSYTEFDIRHFRKQSVAVWICSRGYVGNIVTSKPKSLIGSKDFIESIHNIEADRFINESTKDSVSQGFEPFYGVVFKGL